jgi:CRISPR-associated protein Csd1
MILSSLKDFARRENLLADPDYEPKAVAWIIALDDGGKLAGLLPTAGGEEGSKAKAKVLYIPRRDGRTAAPKADFLVDKSEYVLGIEPDGKRSEVDLARRRELFSNSVSAAFANTQQPSLAAVLAFLQSDDERRRASEQLAADGYKSNDLFAFRHRDKLVHELPDVRTYFSRTRRAGSSEGAQCLICGMTAAPVDKHPAVKIPGGTSSGIALVSFNSDAFESYGLSRNQNAPVCRDCADGYTTALRRLLGDGYPTLARRHVKLSLDTTAVFWADQEDSVIDLFTNYFDSPDIESVASLLKSPHTGRAAAGTSPRFYCLVLSGGQGRATIRSSHIGTVTQVEDNLRRYFESVDIAAEQPMPLMRLMRSLVLQGKLDNLQPGMVTQVFIAIVFGGSFPRTLLTAALGRCRAERSVTRERAAILRAYLKRNQGWEITVSLDKENPSAGYRLGRLMAVLERVQGAAQNNPNKTIVDRYYGAASTRPAVVFPRLIAMSQHHLTKLTGGIQHFYQRRLAEVIDGLATFPPVLSMEEQGLFALGYYHQRQDFFKKTEPIEGEKGEEA